MYMFSKYGRNITNDTIAGKIARDINDLCCSDSPLELDFKEVDLLTTTCIKLVFRPIIEKYGKDEFVKHLSFYNTSKDIQIIISHGLENLVEEYK